MKRFFSKIRFVRKAKSTVTLSTNDAPPFPFLQLPAELRDEIYRHYFGQYAVHLKYTRWGELCSFRCRDIDPEMTSFCWEHSIRHSNSLDADGLPIETGLFYTCMQTYQEASAIFYSSVVFHAASVAAWVRVAKMMSPNHLAMIRTLRCQWIALPCLTMAPLPPGDPRYAEYENYTILMDGHFEEFWDIVGRRMTGLRDLGFVMDYSGQYLSRAITAEWHRHLTKVSGLKNIHLEIWDTAGGSPGQAGRHEAFAREQEKVLIEYLKERMC